MARIQRIVVPVDLTLTTASALQYACAWANLFDSDLHVLHVIPRARLGSRLAGQTAAAPSGPIPCPVRLEDQLAVLPIDPDRVRAIVRHGSPATEIETYARTAGADLIVMVRHQHGLFSPHLWGSVADQVVERAPCGVVTVPRHKAPPTWLDVTRPIVVPLDLGERARETFDYARDLADDLGVGLRAVHVAASGWERQHAAAPWPSAAMALARLTGAVPEASRAPAWPGAGIRSAIRLGEPATTIAAYATEVQAGLMVMATHSRHAGRWFMSSGLTQRLIREAPCPVLTLNESLCGQPAIAATWSLRMMVAAEPVVAA